MDCIEIQGNHPLNGEVQIQGSKNAALPILAGTILHRGITILHNCPRIQDTLCMAEILEKMGCHIQWSGHTVAVDTAAMFLPEVSTDLGSRMRSTVILLGALLGRMKEARLPFPGGCTIGKRPIDIHLDALGRMTAHIQEKDGILEAKVVTLKGICYRLPFPSVGATENLILAAVLAEGWTEISNCAREPEIVTLCDFLNQKGARITGAGTERIQIEGVEELENSIYTLPSDRIVSGTYLCGILAARGKCFLRGAGTSQMTDTIKLAEQMGAVIRKEKEGLLIDAGKVKKAVEQLRTAPYPGFPTDLQSQMMVVLSVAEGESCIVETIFESRFKTVGELLKMGADIRVQGQEARIHGVLSLHGAEVCAPELRGGAALVIAGIIAQGRTKIEHCHYICRGYEDICEDFRQMGAEIYWMVKT